MNKGILISLVALAVALVGAVAALTAYFNRKKCSVCDDFEDDMMDDNPNDIEYFATDLDDGTCSDDCDCGCTCGCDGEQKEEEEPSDK